MTLDDLKVALETYGADRTRWPAPVRHGLASVIAGDGEAARMLREAEALDRLLDMAPTVSDERVAAMAERIAAAASRQPRMVGGDVSVVTDSSGPEIRGSEIRGFGIQGAQLAAARRTTTVIPFRRFEHAFAGAALAASLVLGVVVGQSSVITPALNPAAELLIGETLNDTSQQQLANIDEADGFLDEDLL